jgi:hypothetical protein
MNRKSRLLLFCFIVLAAITLLASSLHDVHFQPGRSLSARQISDTPVLLQMPEAISKTPLWKILLFWLAFVINLLLFFYLLPREVRKRIIRQVVSFSIGILLLFIALRYRIIELPTLNSEPAKSVGQAPPGPDLGGVIPQFQQPATAPWMTFLISLLVITGILILIWTFYRRWMRSQLGRHPSLFAIAGIAQSSLDDLAAGRDWGDVIIESYVRMNKVVSVKRGIQRTDGATPREFAKRLESAGLPAEAVNRLTRLFESVRYGNRKSAPSDIKDAVACLNTILHACETVQ